MPRKFLRPPHAKRAQPERRYRLPSCNRSTAIRAFDVLAVLAAISSVVVFGVLRGETHPWVSAARDALATISVAMAAAVERATAAAAPPAAVGRANDRTDDGGAPLASTHAQTQLVRAARMGSVAGIERALAGPNPSVNELFGETTAMNIALAGWHSAVEAGAAKRYDGYARTVELLIEKGADLALMCPLVDAAHFRNQRAFDLIVAASSTATLRACLSEADAFGDTVLHVVARSPAAGECICLWLCLFSSFFRRSSFFCL